MNVIALDIGNSDIKFGLFRNGELVKFWRASDFAPVHQYKKPGHFSNALRTGLASVGSVFEGIVYSTVVPEMEEILKQTLKYCFTLKRPPLAIKPGISRLPLTVEGYTPGQLGSDRIVSACGAHLMHPGQHIILADFGTATTFDVITADGRFLGGVIAPGIESYASILPQRTSLLPYVPFAPCDKAIGQSTQACMQSGVTFGYLGMVKEIIARIRYELACQYEFDDVLCLATGGGARSFAHAFPHEPIFAQVEPTMTIKGLYALYSESVHPKPRRAPLPAPKPQPQPQPRPAIPEPELLEPKFAEAKPHATLPPLPIAPQPLSAIAEAPVLPFIAADEAKILDALAQDTPIIVEPKAEPEPVCEIESALAALADPLPLIPAAPLEMPTLSALLPVKKTEQPQEDVLQGLPPSATEGLLDGPESLETLMARSLAPKKPILPRALLLNEEQAETASFLRDFPMTNLPDEALAPPPLRLVRD